MKCNKCGTEVPMGSGFCSNCGSIVSVMQSSTQDVKEIKKSALSQETGKKAAIIFVFFILIAFIIAAIVMLIGNLKEEKQAASESTEVAEEISDVKSEEAILGYWESTSYVRVNAMLRNILEKNEISDEVADIIVSLLDISDDAKLALYFKEDNIVRIAINGNMMGEEGLFTYEWLGDSRLIITCDKIELSDLTDLKIGFHDISLEGFGKKIEIPKISHIFEYSIEKDKMKVKVFDEKITFEKAE